MKNITKIGVGVVIIDDNKVLLGHRIPKYDDTGGIYEPDTWTLPGGKLEYKEKIIECAKRETKEETNLDIENIEIFGCGDDIGSDRHFVTIYVHTNKYSGTASVMEKNKIDKWSWFELNNLPENIYTPSEKTLKVYKKIKKERNL